MPQASHPHDCNSLSGSSTPPLQRRVSGDAGTQQRGRGIQGNGIGDLQPEAFINYECLGVATGRRVTIPVVTIRPQGAASDTEVLMSRSALLAYFVLGRIRVGQTRTGHAPHTDMIANGEFRNLVADRGDDSGNLMPRHERILLRAPLPTSCMNIRVADPRVFDVKHDVFGPRI